MAGEIDFMDRHFNINSNKPLFVDGQKKGDFFLTEEYATAVNDMAIQCNMTHKDPQLRVVFADRNFRIGLSYAINRQELIDLIWVGQGEPWQMGPQKTSRFYSEKHAKQYTEYDVKKANEYLDKVLPKKDANGMRLLPDGKPFAVTIDISNTMPPWVSAGPALQKFWKAVGLDIPPKIADRSLTYARKDANDCDIYVWGGGAGLGDAMLDGRSYFPASQESAWGVAWYYWWIKDPRHGAARLRQEAVHALRPAQGHRRYGQAG